MVITLKDIKHYQREILAGRLIEYDVSPGWAAQYSGRGRTTVHEAIKRGILDAVKIDARGIGQSMVLIKSAQVKEYWTAVKKVA